MGKHRGGVLIHGSRALELEWVAAWVNDGLHHLSCPAFIKVSCYTFKATGEHSQSKMSRAGDSPRLRPLASNPVLPVGEDELEDFQQAAARSSSGRTSPEPSPIPPTVQCSGQAQPGTSQSDGGSPGSLAQGFSTIHPSPSEDVPGSRIPRAAGLRQTANTSVVKGHRGWSSLPIPVSKIADHSGPSSYDNQDGPSSSGVRLAEKPRGPRPRPIPLLTAEPTQDPGEISQPNTGSSSGFSSGTWDFKDCSPPPDLERPPPTTFTGEYRIRPLRTSSHPTFSPSLRVSVSAESIIMRGTDREMSESAPANQFTPSLLQRLGNKLIPSSPRAGGTQTDSIPDPQTSAANEDTATHNFCRPQLSLDNLFRRDISSKEMSVSRKPVGKASFTSLLSPSLKSLRTEEEPIVPKIPDQYVTGRKSSSSLRQVSSHSASPETPTKATMESNNTSNTEADATPAPETAIKHPPRTSSLQTSSSLAGGSGTAKNPKRSVTFTDLSPLTSHIEHASQTPGKAKLSESKSTAFIRCVRNLPVFHSFRTDKENVRKEHTDTPSSWKENATPNSDKGLIKSILPRLDSEKSLKMKTKHSRFSVGLGRTPRSVPESPGTPTPMAPRLRAAPIRGDGDTSPTYARGTQSTRIRASYAAKGKSLTCSDGQNRKLHVSTSSSGSPHRLARDKSSPGILTPSKLPLSSVGNKVDEKPSISSSISSSIPSPIPDAKTKVSTAASASAPNESTERLSKSMDASRPIPAAKVSVSTPASPVAAGELTERLPKNLDAFREVVNALCQKIGTSSDPLASERQIRLALQLQEHIGDYRRIEASAMAAQSFAEQKLLERKAAEENLNTALAEAQAQLELD